MLSTASGTGAAATRIIATVPGVLGTRNQSKCVSTYLLKVHNKYDELVKKTKSADKKEYLTSWKACVVTLSIFYREET